MLCAALLMLFAQQTKSAAAARILDGVTALPATIPHTVIGISFLVAFSKPPLPLYGTVFIVLLAYLIMYVPFAARTASAAASEVGHELSEASRVFGASQRTTFTRVLLPLAMPGLATAGSCCSSSWLASSPPRRCFRGGDSGRGQRLAGPVGTTAVSPQLTAMALIMTVINSVFVLAMLRLTRRQFDLAVS